MVEIFGIIGKSFLLGLSTGAFCTGTCLPLLLPVLFSVKNSTIKTNTTALFRFFTGRFVAYLLMGIISGLAGIYLNEWDGFQNILIPSVYFIIGISMIVFGVSGIFKSYNACGKIGTKINNPNYLYVLGFLMGINLCPPFIMAIGVATGLGDILKSLLFFIIFFISTTIFFIPLIFSGFAAKIISLQKAARYISIAVGFYFVYVAIRTIFLLTGLISYEV